MESPAFRIFVKQRSIAKYEATRGLVEADNIFNALEKWVADNPDYTAPVLEVMVQNLDRPSELHPCRLTRQSTYAVEAVA